MDLAITSLNKKILKKYFFDCKKLVKVFGKYGRILKIDKRYQLVFIHYNAIISTQMAKKALDGYIVKELDQQLNVNIHDSDGFHTETVESLSQSEQKSAYSQGGINSQHSTTSVMFLKGNQKMVFSQYFLNEKRSRLQQIM